MNTPDIDITVAKFKYDKEGTFNTHKLKTRNLLVLSKPSDSLFGIEFDHWDEVTNVLEYLQEKALLEQYLKDKYSIDSSTNYKRFKTNKIIGLKEETLSQADVKHLVENQ